MRTVTVLLLLVILGTFSSTPAQAQAPASVAADRLQVVTDAYALIAEVNALRAANGLAPYTVNSILMGIAQQHADFMSVNGVSHTGYSGTRPFQRALNAGYPLAGDLSLGGFISENITAGSNKSVQDAVRQWQGDAPHLNTMLSPNLTEIGAGVTIVNGYVYYVIDAARPTANGQPQVVNTLAPGETPATLVAYAPPLASTAFPNTPLPDGTIYHIVQPGETLWLIAITYNIKVADIRQLNGMSEAEAIYPNEKLLIAKGTGVTATPQPVTATLPVLATPSPSPSLPALDPFAAQTAAPAATATGSPVQVPDSLPATATPEPLLVITREDGPLVLGVILLAAVLLTLVLVRGNRG